MCETPCKSNRPNRDWREADIETYPSGWRNWCKACTKIVQEKAGVDDPAEITDTVLRRTGCGSGRGQGKILHIPASALEEVPASA